MYIRESNNNVRNAAKIMMLLYIASLNYIAIVWGRIADLLFLSFAFCSVLYAITNGIDRKRFNRVAVFIVGILILLFVTYFRASNRSAARTGSWTIIQLLAFDFCFMITIEEPDDIRRCLLAYIIGSYIMIAFVLSKTGLRFMSILPTWRLVRSDGINVNSIGAAAGYSVVILLHLYREERKKLYIYLMILPSLFVIATASRASMLIVLFGIIASVFFSGTRGAGVRLLIVIGGLVMIYQLMKVFNLFSDFTSRFDQLLSAREGIENSDGSTISRYEMLIYGLDEIKKRPLFGYGAGQFRFLGISGHYLGAHNGLIQIGHAFGLVGLAFWYGNMVQAVFRILKWKRQGPEYWIAILAIVQIIMIISSQPLTTKSSHMFLILLLVSSVMVDEDNTEPATANEVLPHEVKGYIK